MSSNEKTAQQEASDRRFNARELRITINGFKGFLIGTLVAGSGYMLTAMKESASSVQESVAGHLLSPDVLHYTNDIAYAGLGVIALSGAYAVNGIYHSLHEREAYINGWNDSTVSGTAESAVAIEPARLE